MKFYLLAYTLISVMLISCNPKLDKSKLISSLQQENLKGDIESITLKVYPCERVNGPIYDNYLYEYSEDGFIKKCPYHTYDEYGRITSDDKKEIYNYNDKGLLTYSVFCGDTTKYIYDENNILIEQYEIKSQYNIEDYYIYNEQGNIHIIQRRIIDKNGKFLNAFPFISYDYNEYDSKGNWTKRSWVRTAYIESQNNIKREEDVCEEREIKYRNSSENNISNQNEDKLKTNDNISNTYSNNSSVISFWGEGQYGYGENSHGIRMQGVLNVDGNVKFGVGARNGIAGSNWQTEQIRVPKGKKWTVKRASAIQHYDNGIDMKKSISLVIVDTGEEYDLVKERSEITLRENDVFVLRTMKTGGEYSIRIEVEFEETNY